MSRVKNASARPSMIAPMTLVAAKVMPRRTSDVMIVPAAPKTKRNKDAHVQMASSLILGEAISKTAG